MARARQDGTAAKTASTNSKTSYSAAILHMLAKIDRPAVFCDSGQCLPVLPGLVVEGFGDVGLPFSAHEAKRLIKLCKQAPYGKGTETLVDTNVRKVWELDTSQFTIENPKWDLMVNSVLRTVEEKLGLPGEALAAQLYKMLVYEKGSFFLPHRDGEKIDRMVATLVVNLPSKHTGGELVIRHLGNEQTIAMSGAASGLETEYAAFYADCQHEVKPLLSGYRLCLTYNLFLAKPKSAVRVTAPDFAKVTQQFATLLSHWQTAVSGDVQQPASDGPPLKLAVMLDHQYTQDGLSIDCLKGIDLAKANIIFDAAEQAECDAHLALVTLWQSGSAESDYGYDYRGRSYSRRDESDSGSEYTMGEVYDSSLSVSDWTDRSGKKVPFGAIPVDEDELVSEVDLVDSEPSQVDFEGYTGNAGMTLERWYHRAAIVLWPRQNQFKVLCDAGTDAAIAGLQRLFKNVDKSPKAHEGESLRDSPTWANAAKLDECRRFAKEIMASWVPLQSYYHWDPAVRQVVGQAKRSREVFWEILLDLQASELISRAWEQILPADKSLTFPNRFLEWQDKQGWKACWQPILSMAKQTSPESLGRNMAFFRQLASLPKRSSECTELCGELAPIILSAIQRIDAEKSDSWNSRIDRQQLIIDLVEALSAIDSHELIRCFFDWQFTHKGYDLVVVQIPAAVQLASESEKVVASSPGIQEWIMRISDELERRTLTEPQQPTDWRRASELSCSCIDCQQLAAFLANPNLAEARFPLAKDRRQHLHGVIERAQCDCTHETLRVGRPQVLICKKTNASYLRACQVYEQDLLHLATIRKIVAKWK